MQQDYETARQIDKLVKTLVAEIEQLRESICSGRCADHAGYRHAVGNLHGLSFALQQVNELLIQPTEPETDD